MFAGNKEPDYDHDLLTDTDDWMIPGIQDDPEFVEAFQWSCCGRRGNAPGCVVTKHSPIISDEDRARYALRTA